MEDYVFTALPPWLRRHAVLCRDCRTRSRQPTDCEVWVAVAVMIPWVQRPQSLLTTGSGMPATRTARWDSISPVGGPNVSPVSDVEYCRIVQTSQHERHLPPAIPV